jgi:glycosyltransferase involved in cell wall biosynthesis
MKAAICVVTFRRPVGLARLLEAMAKLEVPEGWEFEVIVVDNDPAGSARPVVEAAIGLNVRHVLEPERGIPQARNRAMRESEAMPWVAFLDDDEWPEPSWWRRLIEVQAETDADVFLGPSEPVFETEPPEWIVEGQFFERIRFRTATEIPFWGARTSGVLIRRAAFAHLGVAPFDERYALRGGGDVRFFQLMQRAGAKIVWVDDARVNELVPATRATSRWLIQRYFRLGTSRSIALIYDEAGIYRRARRGLRGVLEFFVGLTRSLFAGSKARRMSGAMHAALGVGLVVGAFGIRHDEYAVIHGR